VSCSEGTKKLALLSRLEVKGRKEEGGRRRGFRLEEVAPVESGPTFESTISLLITLVKTIIRSLAPLRATKKKE
jgi:hypothetical protein